jgi:regulatory protein
MIITLITSYVKKYQKKIVGVIELDSGERLELEPDTIMQFQLQTGGELDEKKLREIQVADQKRKCLQKALHLLSIRPRSAHELKERFVRDGFFDETVETSIHYLRENGYLNDELFAERFAKSKLQKKDIGETALRFELHKKGIPKSIIEKVIAKVYGDVSEQDHAVKAGKKKLRTIKTDDVSKKRQKLYQFLAQRGFSADVIRRVMEELLG